MRTRILLAALLILGTLLLRADGCIMKEKTYEIVVFGETSAVFEQNENSATFVNPVTVIFDQELDEVLADAGYAREDIVSAELQGGHYGALANDSPNDWVISGRITVERLGSTAGAVGAMKYTSQSVDAALGKKIPAPLEAGAVDLVNAALADYIAGDQGIQLRIVIENGSAAPAPDASNPMIFTWKVWITMTVVLSDTADLPDPF